MARDLQKSAVFITTLNAVIALLRFVQASEPSSSLLMFHRRQAKRMHLCSCIDGYVISTISSLRNLFTLEYFLQNSVITIRVLLSGLTNLVDINNGLSNYETCTSRTPLSCLRIFQEGRKCLGTN